MIKNICKTCEKTFTKARNPNRVYKYCSSACMGKDREKAKAHSETMKGSTAWNKGMLGKQDWHDVSGLNTGEPWNKGIKGAQEAWNKGIVNVHFLGEKNPNWKGGVTKINERIRKSIEYKQWRTSVFERDNYTCQECGERGKVLNADHIKPFAYFPELRFDINNGRTLCAGCHKATPTYLNRWMERCYATGSTV